VLFLQENCCCDKSAGTISRSPYANGQRSGNTNTAFHHAHASCRMRRNQIRTLEVEGISSRRMTARLPRSPRTSLLSSVPLPRLTTSTYGQFMLGHRGWPPKTGNVWSPLSPNLR
jgi:hypothetical protein